MVIRDGKKVKKNNLNDKEREAGYKIFKGKKVKMSALERIRREKAAMKGALKAKNKRRISNNKRLKSIERRPGGKI